MDLEAAAQGNMWRCPHCDHRQVKMKKSCPPHWIRKQMLKWGRWEDVADRAYIDPEHRSVFAGAWRNKVYSVRIYRGNYPNIKECHVLSITRRDEKPGIPWWIKMVIKEDLIGPEFEAIEIYPRANQIVDPSNIYYLIVLPAGFSLRMHMTHTTEKPPASVVKQT